MLKKGKERDRGGPYFHCWDDVNADGEELVKLQEWVETTSHVQQADLPRLLVQPVMEKEAVKSRESSVNIAVREILMEAGGCQRSTTNGSTALWIQPDS